MNDSDLTVWLPYVRTEVAKFAFSANWIFLQYVYMILPYSEIIKFN